MKKMIVFICILSLLFCSGCNNLSSKNCSDVMSYLLTSEDTGKVYMSTGDISSTDYLSSERLGALYFSEKQAPEELSLVENWCIYISYANEHREIHIYKVKNLSDVGRIKSMLSRRKKLLQSAELNASNYESFLAKPNECEIFSHGNFVFLIAGQGLEPLCHKAKRVS